MNLAPRRAARRGACQKASGDTRSLRKKLVSARDNAFDCTKDVDMPGMNAQRCTRSSIGFTRCSKACKFALKRVRAETKSSWPPLATKPYILAPQAMETLLRTEIPRAKHNIWPDIAQMKTGLYADCAQLAFGRDTFSGLSRRCEPVWPHSTKNFPRFACNCAAKSAESRCEAIEK